MYFAEGERKPSAHYGFAAISRHGGMNHYYTAGRLAIEFKKPWNYMVETPADLSAIALAKEEARGEAPSEATNQFWWCLLEKVRTHFEENPNNG